MLYCPSIIHVDLKYVYCLNVSTLHFFHLRGRNTYVESWGHLMHLVVINIMCDPYFFLFFVLGNGTLLSVKHPIRWMFYEWASRKCNNKLFPLTISWIIHQWNMFSLDTTSPSTNIIMDGCPYLETGIQKWASLCNLRTLCCKLKQVTKTAFCKILIIAVGREYPHLICVLHVDVNPWTTFCLCTSWISWKCNICSNDKAGVHTSDYKYFITIVDRYKWAIV